MRYQILVAAIFLCACDSRTMEQTSNVPQTTIVWTRATPTECGGEPQTSGCSKWKSDHSLCQITMPENSTDAVIAHEFLHCFGYSHIASR